MDPRGWGEILFTIAITVALAVPLGAYLARVWQGERTWLDPVLRPVEGALYWSLRRRSEEEPELVRLRHRRCWCSASPASSCST